MNDLHKKQLWMRSTLEIILKIYQRLVLAAVYTLNHIFNSICETFVSTNILSENLLNWNVWKFSNYFRYKGLIL